MKNRLPDKLWKTFKKVMDDISKMLAIAGMWLIAGIGLLILADIFFRAAGRPLRGIFELVELMLCICAFSAMAYTWMVDGHVRVRLFLQRFGTKLQAALDIAASLAGAVLFGLIAWKNAAMSMYSFRMHDVTCLTDIPIYPVFIMIAFGSAMFTVQMLISCGSGLNRLVSHKLGDDSFVPD